MLFVAEQSASMLGSAACASPPAPNPAVQRWLEKQFARRFPTLSPLALIVIQCAANCNRTSVPLLKARAVSGKLETLEIFYRCQEIFSPAFQPKGPKTPGLMPHPPISLLVW
jgi:hypothetical protein